MVTSKTLVVAAEMQLTTKAQRWKRGKQFIEKALSHAYEEKVVYRCQICYKNIRGFNMHAHIALEHVGRKTNLSSAAKSLLAKARFHVDRLRPSKSEPAKVRWYERNRGKGTLHDAHVPGSNLRKIDK